MIATLAPGADGTVHGRATGAAGRNASGRAGPAAGFRIRRRRGRRALRARPGPRPCATARVHRRRQRRQRSAAPVGNGLRKHVRGRRAAPVEPDPVCAECGAVVRRRREGSLARPAGWPERHRAIQRQMGISGRHGAGQAFPDRQSIDGDTAVHAPPGRRVGRIHLPLERCADRSHARGRRNDRPGRRAGLRHPERGGLPVVPQRGGRIQPGARDRAIEWHASLSADRAELQPDRDAQCDRCADASGRRRSTGLRRSLRYAASRWMRAHGPTCTSTVRSAIGPAGRHRPQWT